MDRFRLAEDGFNFTEFVANLIVPVGLPDPPDRPIHDWSDVCIGDSDVPKRLVEARLGNSVRILVALDANMAWHPAEPNRLASFYNSVMNFQNFEN
jgi:hypothetical protein